LCCTYDFLPSILEYLGLPAPARELPGTSYAAALRGEALRREDEATFHEYENVRTIRTRGWRYTRRVPDGPDELYDLEADPGERWNLAGDRTRADVRDRLAARLAAFFDRHADPKHDLWRGGATKAGRMVPAW
jgi:arylsulfatase A-like enzyme